MSAFRSYKASSNDRRGFFDNIQEISVAELKSLYAKSTGFEWEDEAGILWLSKERKNLDLFEYQQRLSAGCYLTLSDEAIFLVQNPCYSCNPGFPICIIPLRISPESWQAINSVKKQAFKDAIRDRFETDFERT